MTTPSDLIERLAKEAGIASIEGVEFRRERGQRMTLPEQEQWNADMRFARLVAAHCAKLCAAKTGDPAGYGLFHEPGHRCADAIRKEFWIEP